MELPVKTEKGGREVKEAEKIKLEEMVEFRRKHWVCKIPSDKWKKTELTN